MNNPIDPQSAPPQPPLTVTKCSSEPSFLVAPGSGAPAGIRVIESLLKRPGQLIYHLLERPAPELIIPLAAALIVGLAVFGFLLGTVHAEAQLWQVPLKIIGGVLASALICLPSLYIFGSLGGSEARMSRLGGVFFAAITLTSLLLLGFGPVVWLFTQSTTSLAFLGTLGLTLWVLCLAFGLRLLEKAASHTGLTGHLHLRIWMGIFLLVTLQMTSTLRPILGRSESFLPTEKRFFIEHWTKSLNERP